MNELAPLEKSLGLAFSNRALLAQALTHRSFGSPHNERFEFLGDSLLNCVIAIELFERFGKLNEGELSRLRARLVREQTLHEIAQSLAVGQVLRLGEGESKSGGFRRPSILADAVEAIIAAIYIDAGFEVTRTTVVRLFEPMLAGLDHQAQDKDPKTELQELLQGKRLDLPRYQIVATRGAAHDQTFEVQCSIGALDIETTGVGSSRRLAEQEAARAAIARIRAW